VRSAVGVFAASGLTALALVSAGVIYFARQTATDEAIRDSRVVGQLLARGVVEPVLRDDLVTGDPAAIAAMDAAVRTRLLGPEVVRVKIWKADGTIVYSDEPRLIGKQFPLGVEDLAALKGDGVAADISDLDEPENWFERSFDKLLQVYLPVHTPNGTPLLFETYRPYTAISSSGNHILREFLPALIAGLVVLELLQLPLAWSMARGLRRGYEDREALLRRAVEASERERRIIAGELHDGAVQDLVGQSYRLAATADQLAGIAPESAVQAVRDASVHARRTVQELRTLLVDLYPANLRTEGIELALADLATPLRTRGAEVVIAVQHVPALPEQTERLLYRVAREGMRNILKHADARHVNVTITHEGGRVRLVVMDDGRGIDGTPAGDRAAGHVGLDLLRELVADAGGTLTVEPNEPSGTILVAEVPVR
jgi:signal transduction histidine kinase